MKKVLLVMALIGMITLIGCGNKKEDNKDVALETKKEQVQKEKESRLINAEDFEGVWKNSGDETGANYVAVKAVDFDTINVENVLISKDLNVAKIEAKMVHIDSEGNGTFSFDDDRWGNSGTANVKLSSEGVKIEIVDLVLSSGEDNTWKIASGIYNVRNED